MANVSYKDNQGIMLETYKRQLNAFINVGWDLKEWFHLQAMLNVGSSNARNSENAISRYTLEALPFLLSNMRMVPIPVRGIIPVRKIRRTP